MEAPYPDAELKALGERWIGMPRTTAEEQAAAERFYVEQVFPRVRQRFCAQHQDEFRGRYYGVIYSVGTSWEPLVLSWSAVEPQRALFLYTADTEGNVDRVVGMLGLKPTQFDKQMVDKTDPTPIYEAVKRYYVTWRPKGQLAVDFTSGTKAMTSGASMAGAVLGMDLIYVASGPYLRTLNRPVPGTEYLVRVPNPMAVFGDLEEQEAFRLAARHDWAAVRQIASALQSRMPSPRFRALELVAAAYQEWDSFNVESAARAMARLAHWLRAQPAMSVLPAWLSAERSRLEAQAQMLSALATALQAEAGSMGGTPAALASREAAAGLVVSLIAAAQRRARREMYDLGVLLLYRAVELVGQRRLFTYGVDTSSFDPSVLPPPHSDPQALLAAVNERAKKVRFHEQLAALPRRLGLVLGYIILDVIGDPLTREVALEEVARQTEARNHGWLAHGFRVTDRSDYLRFEGFARRLAKAALALDGLSFDQWMDMATFVQPGSGG